MPEKAEGDDGQANEDKSFFLRLSGPSGSASYAWQASFSMEVRKEMLVAGICRLSAEVS